MPLSIDVILENKVIGPAIRRRGEEIAQRAKEEGLEQGMQQGRPQGEVAMPRRLLESRFGPLPATVETRLQGAWVEVGRHRRSCFRRHYRRRGVSIGLAARVEKRKTPLANARGSVDAMSYGAANARDPV